MEQEIYLTPDKALEYGLIDAIEGKRAAEPEKTEELMQKLSDLRREMNSQQSFREQIAKLKQSVATDPEENKILKLFGGKK